MGIILNTWSDDGISFVESSYLWYTSYLQIFPKSNELNLNVKIWKKNGIFVFQEIREQDLAKPPLFFMYKGKQSININ